MNKFFENKEVFSFSFSVTRFQLLAASTDVL